MQESFMNNGGGVTTGNYKVLSMVMDKYKPSSILDVGCGPGRYFRLYHEKNIKDVVGIDISGKALKLANKNFPDVETIKMKVEDIEFEHKRFDLAISNRALQHIPKKNIDAAIEKICYSSNLVYLNELTDSDGVSESKMMLKHDYEKIFERNGFMLKEKGYIEPTEIKGRKIGRQTWLFFSACDDKNIFEKGCEK